MYNGIVFGKKQQKDFLSLAASEKLICEKGMSDGIFGSETNSAPSYQDASAIIEQLVTAGVVYVSPHIYKYLDGEIIYREIIKPYKLPEMGISAFFMYDIDIVQRMLIEKGYDIGIYTIDKIRNDYDEWKDKSLEFISIEDEYRLNYNEISFKKIIGINDEIGCDEIIVQKLLETISQ